jgi:hypothetical protein
LTAVVTRSQLWQPGIAVDANVASPYLQALQQTGQENISPMWTNWLQRMQRSANDYGGGGNGGASVPSCESGGWTSEQKVGSRLWISCICCSEMASIGGAGAVAAKTAARRMANTRTGGSGGATTAAAV